MNFLRRSKNNYPLIIFIVVSFLSIDISQLPAFQTGCPDQFLKNGIFLLKKQKTREALSTFNQIVQNFPKCPQAEEAQWQLVKYYSNVARGNNSDEYYQIASDHIKFYLYYWPKGTYRKSVLKEQDWNRRSLEPLLMRKSVFISLLSVAFLLVIALTLGSK